MNPTTLCFAGTCTTPVLPPAALHCSALAQPCRGRLAQPCRGRQLSTTTMGSFHSAPFTPTACHATHPKPTRPSSQEKANLMFNKWSTLKEGLKHGDECVGGGRRRAWGAGSLHRTLPIHCFPPPTSQAPAIPCFRVQQPRRSGEVAPRDHQRHHKAGGRDPERCVRVGWECAGCVTT